MSHPTQSLQYKRVGLVALLASSATALTLPASVQAQDAAVDDHYSLTVGIGVGVTPDYVGSNDNRVIPAALVRGKVADFAFFSRGTNLFVDAIPDTGQSVKWSFGPAVNYRTDRHGRVDDWRVRAAGKLDRAFEVGTWGGISKTGVFTSDYDNLSFRVSYLGDVTNAHDSFVITPSIEYGTPLSKSTFVGVSVSADYVGKGFGRYYYDISPVQNFTSGLRPYANAGRKAGFSKLNANIIVGQSLTGDLRHGLALFAVGGYGRILGRYADSPIVRDVGSRDQLMGGLGVAYTF